jgi:hypothetical protein
MPQRKIRPTPTPRRSDKLPEVPVVRPDTAAKVAPAEAEPEFDDEAVRRMVEAAYT